jgi:hypothetical protein
VKKLLNLQKALKKWQDRPWPAFKSGGCCTARFSKENYLIGKIFGGLQNCRVGSGWFSKALGAVLINMLSNRGKEFELAGFEKLFANRITFHAKQPRIY